MTMAPALPGSVRWRWPSWLLLALALVVAACDGDRNVAGQAAQPVASIPQDARGHYCGMYLFEHDGPKGQILVRDRPDPVWLTSIREVFVFTRMPDEPRAITGIYVQDMARRQPDGTFPGGAWIDARHASYVIGSADVSGTGVSDALPFGDEAAARAFQQQHGGRVVAFSGMPEDYIFGPGAGAARSVPMGATP